jgi:tripartite-type tricarboxylate transporter receptor subunit TctC
VQAQVPFNKRPARCAALLALAIGGMVLGMASAWGQLHPTRPMRMVVGFAPGGGPDIVARLLADALAGKSGQGVVVDNRPGANGIVGAEIVARSLPDGHTVLVTSASFAINPSIYRKLPFDIVKDFAPVTQIASAGGQVLAVHPSVRARTPLELVSYAKQPGVRLNYASAGLGNATHLAAELFALRTGIHMVHVPYKSAGMGVQALMANEVQVMFLSAAASLPYIRAARVRALAYSGKKRAEVLPEVPTLTEAGIADADLGASWYGAFLPARTPPSVVGQLALNLRTVLSEPPLRAKLAATGLDAEGTRPEDFTLFVRLAARRYAEIARAAKIELQ